MKLADYLKEQGKGTAARLARALRISYPTLWQWAYTDKEPDPRNAVRLELLTERAVMRWDVREDWHEIWPELIGRPGAPAVPTVEAV